MSPFTKMPESIGPFRVEQVLGQGGMASVYLARDTRDGGTVALKVLSDALSDHAEAFARFRDEARMMRQIAHPNVARVVDLAEAGDRPQWIAMELLTGGSLADAVKQRGMLPPVEAVSGLRAVLEALQFLHDNGIVHRDVKPENVMLDHAGTPKLTDFGIARVANRQMSLTQTGSTLGTWAYMAPEQRSNAKDVDGRADVYACGATLFSLLTGHSPVELDLLETEVEIGHQGVAAPLAAAIFRATRYRPENRYGSAAEMGAALAAIPAEDLTASTDLRETADIDREVLRAAMLAETPDLPPTRPAPAPAADLPPTNPPGARLHAKRRATEPGAPVRQTRSQAPAARAAHARSRRQTALLAGVAVLLALGAVVLTLWQGQRSAAARVDARPSAVVLVDGQERGGTPWHGDLAPGAHTLVLRAPDGRTREVVVDGARPVSVCWDFDTDAPCREP